MYVNVNGHDTYCYTGGKAFDPSKPEEYVKSFAIKRAS